MSKPTIKRLTKVANTLAKVADGIINALELVVRDATGTKRSRKGQRSYAQQDGRPIVIVKVIKEK